jgi:endonuclease III
MKNSKDYSQKVHKLYRSLKRKHSRIQKAVYDEPVDALVYAIISENMSDADAQSAIKRFGDYLVDLNGLRVSRTEEIVELLGADIPATRDIASALTRALKAVFDKYNVVSLKVLQKMGKRLAKHILEKIDGTSRFVVNYCMLTSLQGHAVPLTKRMIDYLRNSQLVDPDADEQQIEGFLTRQISAENAYEFYVLLRHQSERTMPKQKKPLAKQK